MIQFIILIISLVLIAVCFLSFGMKRAEEKDDIPNDLEVAFLQHVSILLAPLKVKVESVQLSNFKLLAEIPFESGKFEFYNFEYNIKTEKPVATGNGIVLNTAELLQKAGVKGNFILLFYREEEEFFEISFIGEREIAQAGYKGYIANRYANSKTWETKDEYAIRIENTSIVLWQNLKGGLPFPFAVKTRERSHDIIAYTNQFTDTWEGLELKISTWVQFEKKKELIYLIKSTSAVAETPRGIHVGNSVEELKRVYSREELSYKEDFKGAGPCYGFIPKDGTNRYIAFFVADALITEIWITDGFDDRQFEPPSGYVDNDVDWIEYDNSEKLSEKYAREIYIGQHKSDFDSDKVFNSFIAKELNSLKIIEKGLLHEGPGKRVNYIVCENQIDNTRLHVEVELIRTTLKNAITSGEIWLVDRYRSQIIYNI